MCRAHNQLHTYISTNQFLVHLQYIARGMYVCSWHLAEHLRKVIVKSLMNVLHISNGIKLLKHSACVNMIKLWKQCITYYYYLFSVLAVSNVCQKCVAGIGFTAGVTHHPDFPTSLTTCHYRALLDNTHVHTYVTHLWLRQPWSLVSGAGKEEGSL